ncbi:MAG TPA: helix-turn-helix transcriptional regulator [Blastocatellia bacterium]|nr:helix-turn-helix transcriptional regulator [Blastocatellia bacterium]
MKHSKLKPCPKCHGTGHVDDPRGIGQELQELRKKARLPLRVVAAKMDISISYVSDMEQGRKPWTIAKIEAYRRAIELDA